MGLPTYVAPPASHVVPTSPLLRQHRPTELSAARVAHLVRTGRVSALAVVEAHLDRISDAEPWTRALVHVDREGALAQARAVDVRRAAGRDPGPLAGVPVAVKDNIDVLGQVTSCGSKAHGDPARVDAEVTRRLRLAGAVLVGRANMDELAMGASTQTSAFGRTHNPHDVRRSAGGSSGGSAAAVAAHEAMLSVGTDTGGSVREPASQCGVVGMAPTPGLVPLRGVVPFAPGLDRVGPLARTVEDAALLLAVLGDRPGLAAVTGTTVLRGLRVGVLTQLRSRRNQSGVLARLDATVGLLRGLGAEVVELSAPAAGRALATYMTITSAACVPTLAPYVRTGLAGAEVERRYAWGLELLREVPSPLEVAEAARAVLHAQVMQALDGCDVLLSPTMPTTAPLLEGHASPEDLADPLAAPYTDCWTVVANLTGLPALSLPSGRSPDDGMPVGTMLMGQPRSDHLLLRLAAALEAAGVDHH
jgi:aspartyl-tRNA(Asn)/glutamyl-tRNA(Gln) amidotransferase subunit A